MKVAVRFRGCSHVAHYRLVTANGAQTLTLDHEGHTMSARLYGIEPQKVAEVLMGELVQERWDEQVRESMRRDRLAHDEARREVDRQANFTGL